MKRFFFIATLAVLILCFNSCEEDRWGYDNKVIFSANGGTEDVDGDNSIYHLSIGDYNGNEKGAVEEAGVMTVTYDWLTATAVKGDNEILSPRRTRLARSVSCMYMEQSTTAQQTLLLYKTNK